MLKRFAWFKDRKVAADWALEQVQFFEQGARFHIDEMPRIGKKSLGFRVSIEGLILPSNINRWRVAW